MTTEPRAEFTANDSIADHTPHLHVVETTAEIIDATKERSSLYSKIGSVSSTSRSKNPDITITSDDTLAINKGEILLADDRMFVFNALLKNIGRPLRAEELRAEGFYDRPTISQTRAGFKRAVSQLMRELNDTSDAPIIERHGITKGTRYFIPDTINIADERNSEGRKQSEFMRRESILTELSAQYHDHPYVLEKLSQFENSAYNSQILKYDEVGVYVHALGKYRLLTAIEEVELFTAIENGIVVHDAALKNDDGEPDVALLDLVAARQIIFNTNLRLAFKYAMKKRPFKGTMSEIDLVHEANFGLLQAIPRMDISKGLKFSTYATHWINQSMTRAIANKSREIRIPVHVHERFVKVSRALSKKASELGRNLTEDDIFQFTGMSILDYNELMRIGKNHLISLNQYVDDSHETELGDLYTPLYQQPENGELQHIEANDALMNIIDNSTLSDNEKFIMAMRYGLGNVFPKKLKVTDKHNKPVKAAVLLHENQYTEIGLEEIGKHLNLSAERIRQIESLVLKKLRLVALAKDLVETE